MGSVAAILFELSTISVHGKSEHFDIRIIVWGYFHLPILVFLADQKSIDKA